MPKIHFGAQEYINVLSAKGSGYWAAVHTGSFSYQEGLKKKKNRYGIHNMFKTLP